ncbi:MAG: GMC family oxidoreductase [Flavobacteriales bacterium]|nr:GMC family oxidoreductase [Flavobacteriales bacterium]
MPSDEILDHIVIGSGFGGSVSAMRLAEKGYSVLVMEKGKRWRTEEFPRTNWSVRKFLWAPVLRCFGPQQIELLNRIMVLSGAGVGGGSLIYANTHMMPPDAFFDHPAWSRFGDWKERLTPHYATARFMLGSARYDQEGPEDRVMAEIARDMGKADTYKPVDHVGVYLGDPTKATDPYFNGLGPKRTGCTACANCMVGCRFNAKNTLDKNYLWFAERFGARIEAETEVTRIEHFAGVYHVHTKSSTSWLKGERRVFRAKGLVVSAGVMGTLKLLMRQKHELRTLPALSDQLGASLRTNSESLCGISGIPEKMNHGVAISRVFEPDEHTHIELVKYGDGSGAMGLLAVMAAGEGPPLLRVAKSIWNTVTQPRKAFNVLRRDFGRHSIILLVMQTLDNAVRVRWKQGLFGGKLSVAREGGKRVPAYIGIGQEVMHRYAAKTGGTAMNALPEVLLNMSSTAHILGGCPMGADAGEGVVNERFEAFGYPELRILDGSIIPANLGVNPSLTITALSEYAMSLVPRKPGHTGPTLDEQLAARA